MKAPDPLVNTGSCRRLTSALAQRMMQLRSGDLQEVCRIGIIDFEKWEWPQGVGLYGLYQLARFDGDPGKRAFLQQWYERRMTEGLPTRNINTTAPMLTFACLAEESGQPDAIDRCVAWAEWLMRELPRTDEGGFQHVTSDFPFEQQLWTDTLFMTVLFLAKTGAMTRRQDFIEESIHQFLLHTKYLHDRRTGLWFHGWTFAGRHNFAEALWARGNCWFTGGLVDFLEMVRVPPGVQTHLLATLRTQAEALAHCQNASGMWHTLLNDPGSYVESSATAGFAYGLLKGVRLGYLDARFRDHGWRAVQALMERILPDGTVTEVSYGTPMGDTLDHYRRIPLSPMAYGQALALLALTEASRLLGN